MAAPGSRIQDPGSLDNSECEAPFRRIWRSAGTRAGWHCITIPTNIRCSLPTPGCSSLLHFDKEFTDNTIYHTLFSDKLSADLEHVYENAIDQMLKAAGHELYYYTFPTESGKHNYEEWISR